MLVFSFCLTQKVVSPHTAIQYKTLPPLPVKIGVCAQHMNMKTCASKNCDVIHIISAANYKMVITIINVSIEESTPRYCISEIIAGINTSYNNFLMFCVHNLYASCCKHHIIALLCYVYVD